LSDKMRLSSILYWSGGSGGGTGTYGSVSRKPAVDGNLWFASSPWVWDWDAEIAQNSNNVDSTFHNTENRSTGILRNSINRQSTIGLISKLNYDLSDLLKLQVGIDWRTAGIEHTREVRDLLGGDYYVDDSDPNQGDEYIVRLGDNIDYHNETTVDWIGGFAQASFEAGALNAYGMAGFSSIKYSYQDLFTIAQEVIKSESIGAMQFKGGGMYHLSENFNVFGNFGYVEKPPIMDNVIYFDGTVASDPDNEKFISSEVGLTYNSRLFAVTANAYNTDWKDRNLTRSVDLSAGSSGDTDVIFLTGVNQNHAGVEIEASVMPIKMLQLDASISMGNWKFTGDASGDYQDAAGNLLGVYTYGLKDLKVGDMPQSATILGATLMPIKGLRVQALYSMYADNYSDWSPESREIADANGDNVISQDEIDAADRKQVWQAPDYSKLDLHVTYDLPRIAGINAQVFAHVFNALDAVYVQDAVDESRFNSYGTKDHLPHNAEVFLGTPRWTNMGLKLRF